MIADWRELPAGPELDRVVAEKLGWTDLHMVDEFAMSERERSFSGPEPYSLRRLYGLRPTGPILPDERYAERVPWFSRDLNVAIAACRDVYLVLKLNPEVSVDIADIITSENGNNVWHEGVAPKGQAALAVCRALLTCVEAQSG